MASTCSRSAFASGDAFHRSDQERSVFCATTSNMYSATLVVGGQAGAPLRSKYSRTLSEPFAIWLPICPKYAVRPPG